MSGIRKLLLGALVSAVAVIAIAPAASAAPNPGFEQFYGCPVAANVPFCITTTTTGGHLKIGATDTPINKTIEMSGGVRLPDSHIVFNKDGGLKHDPLEVPGGLTGLTGLSEFIINLITFGANKVYAQSQLVADPVQAGSILVMPLRVKLINPFLTSTCGIGSAASPITLNLTTGTTSPPPPNKPITGRANDGIPDPKNPNITLGPDEKFVDNAFAAPAASGCDLFGFGLINALVNARAGLPSPAGNNEAVLDHTDVRIAFPAFVWP